MNGDVHLPANAAAMIQQSSLLGEKYVELAPPGNEKPEGQLGNGSDIPLSRTNRNVEVEELLGALSLVLNGGGLAQLQTINHELGIALQGRESGVKNTLTQLDTFIGGLDQQKSEINRALDSVNALAGTLAQRTATINTALDNIGPGLAVLNQQHDLLVNMLKSLARLGHRGHPHHQPVGARHRRGPEVAPADPHPARRGRPDLAGSLDLLLTYPFPASSVTGDPNYRKDDQRTGGYALFTNMTATLQLDLRQRCAATPSTRSGALKINPPTPNGTEHRRARGPHRRAAPAPRAAAAPLSRARAVRRSRHRPRAPARQLRQLRDPRAALPATGRCPSDHQADQDPAGRLPRAGPAGHVLPRLQLRGPRPRHPRHRLQRRADFKDSGGIFVNAEVTYRGVAVGRVSDMKLRRRRPRGVQHQAGRRQDPCQRRAFVATRSAVGEQYVTCGRRTKAPYLTDGSVIPQNRTGIPIPVEQLLLHLDHWPGRSTAEPPCPVDELGKAFNGTGDSLGRLIDNGDLLLSRAQTSLPQTLKLINDSQTVLDTQIASRSDIQNWAADLRLVTDTLVQMTPTCAPSWSTPPMPAPRSSTWSRAPGPGWAPWCATWTS